MTWKQLADFIATLDSSFLDQRVICYPADAIQVAAGVPEWLLLTTLSGCSRKAGKSKSRRVTRLT
jgi:hypothetical protein